MDEQRAREFILKKQAAGVDYGYFKPLQDSHVEFAAAEVTEATRELRAQLEESRQSQYREAIDCGEAIMRAEATESAIATEQARVRELTEALSRIDTLCDGGDDIVIAIRQVAAAALGKEKP